MRKVEYSDEISILGGQILGFSVPPLAIAKLIWLLLVEALFFVPQLAIAKVIWLLPVEAHLYPPDLNRLKYFSI